jgi:phage gp36-like protein
MYATQQDMIDRFGTPKLVQLTDINLPMTGELNAVVLDRALGDASAEIDGYLVGRVALPLANPPAVLTVHCCTIALYRLLGSAADENTRKAYELVCAYLAKVADGRIALTPPAETPPLAGVGSVWFEPGGKVMGREA